MSLCLYLKYVCMYMYVCVYVCYLHVYISCMYACMCIYIYVCVCIYGTMDEWLGEECFDPLTSEAVSEREALPEKKFVELQILYKLQLSCIRT